LGVVVKKPGNGLFTFIPAIGYNPSDKK